LSKILPVALAQLVGLVEEDADMFGVGLTSTIVLVGDDEQVMLGVTYVAVATTV
jgi:hypothetical protein